MNCQTLSIAYLAVKPRGVSPAKKTSLDFDKLTLLFTFHRQRPPAGRPSGRPNSVTSYKAPQFRTPSCTNIDILATACEKLRQGASRNVTWMQKAMMNGILMRTFRLEHVLRHTYVPNLTNIICNHRTRCHVLCLESSITGAFKGLLAVK